MKHTTRFFFHAPAILLLLFGLTAQSQIIRINEVVSSNSNTFYDEHGNTPDWIELYNSGANAVNLSGYGISDDAATPFKWVFPDYTLGSGKFLVLAASGTESQMTPVFWETIIAQNDTFSYLVPNADPGSWTSTGYNDASWLKGRSGFGYGDNDDTTEIPSGSMSVMLRKTFVIKDLSLVKKLMLHMDYDDGFVAYINGHEIARAQIGTAGTPPAWNQAALSADHEATMYQGGAPDSFSCDAAIPFLVEGNNLFAVEVHNNVATSSDMSCIPFLSLGLSHEPDSPLGHPIYLKFPDLNFHLNFKISASGEKLVLTKPDGTLSDSIYTGALANNVSLGLQPDGSSARWYFSEPTPGISNNASKAYPEVTATDPVFSIPGGYFTSPIEVTLSGADAGDSIMYTTNGSDPATKGIRYTGAIYLSESKVIKAIIAGPDRMKRRPVTQSYLFRNEAPTLTTISLSTDSLNFFDYDTGIYVLGPNASTENPNFGANFWNDWERPVNIQLFEKDGSLGFESDAGVKIFGAWSRANPQKSLAFYARGKYGASSFKYKFFPDLPFKEYDDFILRNSGNDWNSTMIRDAMMTSLLDQTNLDRQAYRPASVYLNGSYWGLLNLREKINEHFIAAHHNINPYEIDLLEGDRSVLNGDADHYNLMLDYLNANSPSIKSNYEHVKTLMDVENFQEYELAQIYFNNTDWPGNNIRYWRPRTTDGRWRWIIYDTDFGFGIWDADQYRYTFNTLSFALATNSGSYANAPWATFLLRRLMENQEFKYGFINRFADQMNTSFSYDHVLERINEMSSNIAKEMPYHYAKWSRWGEGVGDWNYNLETLRTFAHERLSYMRTYISQQFGNIGYANLTVNTSSSESGTVHLSTLELESFPWTGIYFKSVPIPVIAKPKTGYRFVSWEGPVADPLSDSTTVTIAGPATIKAIFESDGTNLNDVVINEIYYNDPEGFNCDDWVEITNKGSKNIDLSGWILKDEEDKHRFVVPQGVTLASGSYLIFCRDTAKFAASYTGDIQYIGDFNFGLGSNGDCVRLFTADSILVDTVRYGVSAPWPDEPNETGTSIELINTGYDNSLAINWTASAEAHGTPGRSNDDPTPTGNGDQPASSEGVLLLESHPNPFNLVTTIHYEVPKRQWVRISIVDITGNTVSVLQEGEIESGVNELNWDGCGQNGKRLPSGVYICTMQSRESIKCLRLVIL